jgi:hypothetical protein
VFLTQQNGEKQGVSGHKGGGRFYACFVVSDLGRGNTIENQYFHEKTSLARVKRGGPHSSYVVLSCFVIFKLPKAYNMLRFP